MTRGERAIENLVLAEESRQTRHASDSESANQERPVRHRQLLLEPSHMPEILLSRERVNNGAGSQKEQRLEERVREQMKNAGRIRPNAHGHEHVAELGHR